MRKDCCTVAKDDYFVLVNKFLRYLYKCLKQGLLPDWSLLAPKFLGPAGEIAGTVVSKFW